jgi:hypothetical protein
MKVLCFLHDDLLTLDYMLERFFGWFRTAPKVKSEKVLMLEKMNKQPADTRSN